MVNELRDLMQELVAAPPEGDTDLGAVLEAGRGRVRRRRSVLAAGVAAVVATVAGAGAWTFTGGDDGDRVAHHTVPRVEGPVLHLSDAVAGVEGQDYDVVSSYTNKDLDAANGQYYRGVTDDGLILFEDGPRGVGNRMRLALLDPSTGEKDWLPAHDVGSQPSPVELSRQRLVLLSSQNGDGTGVRAEVYDRTTRTWSSMSWPTLPATADVWPTRRAPDGRLWVAVPATHGSPPPGGWPTGPGGEADDSGAEGETRDLWSVSLDDASDVRDEQLRVGSFTFTEDTLVWSDSTDGTNDRIHVRDLASGAEHDFDPRSGERCNLLGFGASGDRIVLSQFCGTYDDGRDDRVQVLTSEGEQVTTIQGDGIDGFVTGDGLVQVTSHGRGTAGTYVYEPDSGRLVRVSDGVSSYALGGPTPAGYLLWDTPYGTASSPQEPIPGATQWLARWRS